MCVFFENCLEIFNFFCFLHFFIATGIGQLPATIVYSWAGSLLTGGTFWFVTGLFILFALSVVISVARSLYLERQRKKT